MNPTEKKIKNENSEITEKFTILTINDDLPDYSTFDPNLNLKQEITESTTFVAANTDNKLDSLNSTSHQDTLPLAKLLDDGTVVFESSTPTESAQYKIPSHPTIGDIEYYLQNIQSKSLFGYYKRLLKEEKNTTAVPLIPKIGEGRFGVVLPAKKYESNNSELPPEYLVVKVEPYSKKNCLAKQYEQEVQAVLRDRLRELALPADLFVLSDKFFVLERPPKQFDLKIEGLDSEYDFSEEKTICQLMPLAKGRPLKDLYMCKELIHLAQKNLYLANICFAHIIKELLLTLLYLKKMEMLHGDLTTQNIYITPDGTIQILDLDTLQYRRRNTGSTEPVSSWNIKLKSLKVINKLYFSPFLVVNDTLNAFDLDLYALKILLLEILKNSSARITKVAIGDLFSSPFQDKELYNQDEELHNFVDNSFLFQGYSDYPEEQKTFINSLRSFFLYLVPMGEKYYKINTITPMTAVEELLNHHCFTSSVIHNENAIRQIHAFLTGFATGESINLINTSKYEQDNETFSDNDFYTDNVTEQLETYESMRTKQPNSANATHSTSIKLENNSIISENFKHLFTPWHNLVRPFKTNHPAYHELLKIEPPLSPFNKQHLSTFLNKTSTPLQGITQTKIKDQTVSLKSDMLEIIWHWLFGVDQQVCVVWGTAGSGKTTLAKEVCDKLCENNILAIYINDLVPTASSLASYQLNSTRIAELCKEGPLVIIVDDFQQKQNIITQLELNKPDSQNWIPKIIVFARIKPDYQTANKTIWFSSLDSKIPDFTEIYLQPIPEQSIFKVFSTYKNNNPEDFLGAKSNWKIGSHTFHRLFSKNPALYKFSTNPRMLNLLIEVVPDFIPNVDMPTNRINWFGIYEQLISAWITLELQQFPDKQDLKFNSLRDSVLKFFKFETGAMTSVKTVNDTYRFDPISASFVGNSKSYNKEDIDHINKLFQLPLVLFSLKRFDLLHVNLYIYFLTSKIIEELKLAYEKSIRQINIDFFYELLINALLDQEVLDLLINAAMTDDKVKKILIKAFHVFKKTDDDPHTNQENIVYSKIRGMIITACHPCHDLPTDDLSKTTIRSGILNCFLEKNLSGSYFPGCTLLGPFWKIDFTGANLTDSQWPDTLTNLKYQFEAFINSPNVINGNIVFRTRYTLYTIQLDLLTQLQVTITPLHKFSSKSPIQYITISPNKQIIVYALSQTVKIVHLNLISNRKPKSYQILTYDFKKNIRSLLLNNSTTILAINIEDKIYFFRTKENETFYKNSFYQINVQDKDADRNNVNTCLDNMSFHPTQNSIFIYTLPYDQVPFLCIHDLNHKLQIAKIKAPNSKLFVLSPNGKYLLITTKDQKILIYQWDDFDNKDIKEISQIKIQYIIETYNYITRISFCPNNQFFITENINGELFLYEKSDNDKHPSAYYPKKYLNFVGNLLDYSFIGNEDKIIIVSKFNNKNIYKIEKVHGLNNLILPKNLFTQIKIKRIVSNENSNFFGTLGKKTLHLWNINDGSYASTISHPDKLLSAWPITKNRHLFCLCKTQDPLKNELYIWKVNNNESNNNKIDTINLLKTVLVETNYRLQINPDSNYFSLYTVSGHIKLYEIAEIDKVKFTEISSKTLFLLNDTALLELKFHPEGNSILISLTNGTVVHWDYIHEIKYIFKVPNSRFTSETNLAACPLTLSSYNKIFHTNSTTREIEIYSLKATVDSNLNNSNSSLPYVYEKITITFPFNDFQTITMHHNLKHNLLLVIGNYISSRDITAITIVDLKNNQANQKIFFYMYPEIIKNAYLVNPDKMILFTQDNNIRYFCLNSNNKKPKICWNINTQPSPFSPSGSLFSKANLTINQRLYLMIHGANGLENLINDRDKEAVATENSKRKLEYSTHSGIEKNKKKHLLTDSLNHVSIFNQTIDPLITNNLDELIELSQFMKLDPPTKININDKIIYQYNFSKSDNLAEFDKNIQSLVMKSSLVMELYIISNATQQTYYIILDEKEQPRLESLRNSTLEFGINNQSPSSHATLNTGKNYGFTHTDQSSTKASSNLYAMFAPSPHTAETFNFDSDDLSSSDKNFSDNDTIRHRSNSSSSDNNMDWSPTQYFGP
ncbi:MAG: hypothetical protein Tsb005_00580 [Gammaproteobacteria bacterium]